jgi:poly-gamma-glutamate synthesis protein (capsule biosynthesis protein)
LFVFTPNISYHKKIHSSMRNFSIIFVFLAGTCMLSAQTSDHVTLLFAGDVTLSDNVQDHIGLDTSYVFQLWKPGEEYDIFMVNLEHPVTTAVDKVEKKFNFKMNPGSLGTLKNGGVSLVNCANNHVFDYGLQGIEETIKNLESAGVKYVGIGRNLREARTPVLLEKKGRRFGFLGYYGGGDFAATSRRAGFAPRYERYILEDVRSLREKADFVVVNFHWGTERAPEPEPWQIRLAHRVIEAGADLIVGHHPHVLQGIEEYRGKHIAYSLGNFVFGGNTLHTYATGVLKVTVGDSVVVELLPVSVTRWRPAPAVGDMKRKVLRLVEERSQNFTKTHFGAGAEK